MKNLNLKYFLIVLLMGLFACGKDEPAPEPVKTPEQLAVESLAGKSSIQYFMGNSGTVTKNGNSQAHLFDGFEIRFASSGSSKTYTTQNADFLFENSGTWSFVGEDFQKIKLSGSKPASNREISFTRTETELFMQFNIDPPAGGKVNAVAGSYQIRLNIR